MSVLLGVRRSSQQTEGHEGVAPQPGSLYNRNPPPSIWGNPPTFPLWHDLPVALSSSMRASSSMSAPSWMMEQEQQLQRSHMARDKANQDFDVPLTRMEGQMKYETSVPSLSPPTSRSVTPSTWFGKDMSDTFKFVFKSSGVEKSADTLPDAGKEDFVESNFHMENEKSGTGKCFNKGSGFETSCSIEDLRKDFEAELSVHALDLENVKEVQQNIKPETLDNKLSSSSAIWKFSEPRCVSEDEETPEVFVFGSSGSSRTGHKAGLQQQKSFNRTFAASSSRLRTSKFKRHSNIAKSKGPPVPRGVGSQEVLSDFSRDPSPQSNSGVDSVAGSVYNDDEDAGIWSEEKVDAGSHLERSRLFQPTQVFVGPGLKDDEQTWFAKGSSTISMEDSHPGFNFTQQDSSSHYEVKEPLGKQNENSQRYPCMFSKHVDDEASEPKSEYNASNLAASIERIDTPAGRPSSSQVKLTPSFAENDSQNWQNLPKTSQPSKMNSFLFNISEGNFRKEPIDATTSNVHNQVDSSMFVWNTGSREHAKPFTFGASQASTLQAHSSGGGILSTDEPYVYPTNADPATSTYYSSKSSGKHDNEGPRGEFSGPISSSDSECSLNRRYTPATKDDGFKFLGNTKETLDGPALVKKKPPASSNRRKHGRGSNRQRRVMESRSFNEASVTPMDFSPINDETPGSVGAIDLEHPYLNPGKQTLNLDETEIWRHLTEIETLNEHNLGSSHQNMNFGLENLVTSEDLHDCRPSDWGGPLLSSKRSGKWKRSVLVEGESLSTQLENRWVASQSEKEDKSVSGGHSESVDRRNFGTTFVFGTSSVSACSSSTAETKFGQLYETEKATEIVSPALESFTSTIGQDGFGNETVPNDGVGYMHVQDQADKNGLSRVLRTSNVNTSSIASHNSNVDEHASLKGGDDSNHSASGYSFLAGVQDRASAVKSAAAEQVCERWRLRGNQAYANGDFLKAEEYYSRGASSISPDETSQSCIRAAMLCYSNRAATRMAVGRMRDALTDCKRAMVVDPSFLRVRLRAASCHLALGEIKEAADMFKDCQKYAKEENPPDSKVLMEAMEGAKKCQQVDDYSDRALELLQKQNLTDSTAALRLVNEALSTSLYSESLHELKGQILLSLRRYEEVLLLCEQSLPIAERNHGLEKPHVDASTRDLGQGGANLHLCLWRWRLNAKALYHLGRLDEAFELLTRYEEAIAISSVNFTTSRNLITDSLAPFMASIRDLLRHKAAGNEAFQLGKHAEAVEHYTAALACNGESRPYLAVCFCNRAAASQALGQLADAIADCSRAIALDSVYPKALSRRATLHELIRDYGQACNDLRRLISLLEGQLNGRTQANKGGSSGVSAQDLKQARERFEKAEDDMKKDHPIDHYLILGLDFLCSANEIKKAYRKAALKHHPDKAGQFLARGENGDDGSLWKEVGDDVRRDAERLFKLIGEAYAILSDPTKRLRYDAEEEHRKLRGKDSNSTQVFGSASEGYWAQYESGRRQRDRWDPWQGFTPQQCWQSGPDAAQPDMYGRRSTYSVDTFKTG